MLGDFSGDLLSFFLTNCNLGILVFENVVQFMKFLSLLVILLGNENTNEGEA